MPKDGPSAGITMASSLISALIKKPITKDLAMTGEITLRGMVLPVGGIREKVIAAKRAGINTIILPRKNKKDLEEIPKKNIENIQFHFINEVEELIDIAFKSDK